MSTNTTLLDQAVSIGLELLDLIWFYKRYVTKWLTKPTSKYTAYIHIYEE